MSRPAKPISKHRFTGESKTYRSRRGSTINEQVKSRDGYRCVFCGASDTVTVDHLIPLASGGTDEMTNYVTACWTCNQRKADLDPGKFALIAGVQISDLPVSGDPIIDNPDLPHEVRALRKRIYDAVRSGDISARGKSSHKKIEKEFRRELWQTDLGKKLIAEQPELPGHSRAMLPEIESVAQSERERLLLIELSKSARTRELIAPQLALGDGVEVNVVRIAEKCKDPALKKRLEQAIRRFRKEFPVH